MRDVLNYVGGRFQPAARGAWLDDLGPATGEKIARIPASTSEDVDLAVTAAAEAMAGPWGRTTWAERADLCDAIADGLAARASELAELESLDTGKPRALAVRMDIGRAVANFRFFAGAVRHQATGCHDMGSSLNYTVRQPVGVVGLITPWNLPLYLLTWKAAPALACGNAVVAKPSELTPLTAHALAEVVDEVGLPAGAFNLVHGDGPSAGAPLVAHPDVAAISFTGGTSTGEAVAAAAGRTHKKLSLELGGRNPTVVFADADPEAALDGALRAGFTNQGEICLCGSRLLVEASIAPSFVERLRARVDALNVGDPSAPGTDLGALISASHRDKVEGYLRLAVEEGGTVHGGGRPELAAPWSNGFFLRPALVTGLGAACRSARDEIFGPVVTVHPFRDEDEAVSLANGVRYGLSASVWTRELSRAHRVARRIQAGMVWVNCWLVRDLRVPFGGVKHSGVGREGGEHSLQFYTDEKNVCVAL